MHIKRIVYIVLIAVFLLPAYAYAYIDPGTGSLVLQALIAGGITALAFVRGIREKILDLFRSKKEK